MGGCLFVIASRVYEATGVDEYGWERGDQLSVLAVDVRAPGKVRTMVQVVECGQLVRFDKVCEPRYLAAGCDCAAEVVYIEIGRGCGSAGADQCVNCDG
ncbi:hypothetical protein ACZ91_56840 [Streptomyces regensis]|nr:hypothetical protein ACZ91_56840 [Streptomyces regensis]